ncbi:MAG: extracellular solute-binding protein, partial [Desulfovibrio sp.]|nr:extracellular solute-binding protein [Desulfovibrio sp.]
MRKKTIAFFLILCMALTTALMAGCGGGPKPQSSGSGAASSGSGSGAAAAKNKLVIYTSMKEALIKGIVEGFKKKNPGIEVDYQSAGAGKLMAKIA